MDIHKLRIERKREELRVTPTFQLGCWKDFNFIYLKREQSSREWILMEK